MKIAIDNGKESKENLVLTTVFVGTGILAFILILAKLPLPLPLKALAIIVLSGLWLLPLLAVKKGNAKRSGSLVIDIVSKTFSMNGKSFLPYASLDFYDFSTVGSWGTMNPYSSMYVSIGGEGEIFRFNDDDASKRMKLEEISALSELIAGSSISEEEKQSFEGWVARCKMKRKKD